MRISYEVLKSSIVSLLTGNGFAQDEATAVAEEMAFAEARGKNSHGLNMLAAMLRRKKSTRGAITVLQDGATSALIEGGGSIGPVVARFAVSKGIEKAGRHGM